MRKQQLQRGEGKKTTETPTPRAAPVSALVLFCLPRSFLIVLGIASLPCKKALCTYFGSLCKQPIAAVAAVTYGVQGGRNDRLAQRLASTRRLHCKLAVNDRGGEVDGE